MNSCKQKDQNKNQKEYNKYDILFTEFAYGNKLKPSNSELNTVEGVTNWMKTYNKFILEGVLLRKSFEDTSDFSN